MMQNTFVRTTCELWLGKLLLHMITGTHAAGGTGGSFMCSCAAIRMFSGLRSVCTRPSSWMYATDTSSCRAIACSRKEGWVGLAWVGNCN